MTDYFLVNTSSKHRTSQLFFRIQILDPDTEFTRCNKPPGNSIPSDSRRYFEDGASCSVNLDDPAVIQVDMDGEYSLLRRMGFNEAMLATMVSCLETSEAALSAAAGLVYGLQSLPGRQTHQLVDENAYESYF